ncbi:MAG: hypothetical protein JWO54_354 [Candidatus Saccharibacteria bacterium]|nr:hypothetical protein [Candidatus Saccharibacteria bacterium]
MVSINLAEDYNFQMTSLQKWIIGITGGVTVGLIGWIFWYVSQTELSPQLGTLFNVLLTVFSIVISLIVSQYYSDASRKEKIAEIKSDYKKNNKLYSQKAAEKVDNLSNELTKLSIYLQQSIDESNSSSPVTTLLVQEEKIRSAIHIVETLKSINDRSLSDWLGVLDEEDIEEQNEIREEQREERETDFKNILDNYRFITSESAQMNFSSDKPNDTDQFDTVHSDLNELTKKIDKLATSIIGTPIKTRKPSLPKEDITVPCPNCQTSISYKQRPSATSVKGIKCLTCSTKLVARWSTVEGFTLSIRPDEYVGSAELRVVPEAIVEAVKKELPEQPWPKGTSQRIAKKIGISNGDMARAIDALVDRGDLKVQVNGKLYEPISGEEIV